MPKLRQNPITGDWVVIAPERAKRPHDYVQKRAKPKKEKGTCPFCPGGEAYKNRLPNVGTKHFWVVKNKFPAFVPKLDIILDAGADLYYSQKSTGDHEVINYTDHNKNLQDWPPSHFEELFTVYKPVSYTHLTLPTKA